MCGELAYLLMFALKIGIGLRYLGVLLMGARIIIPAVAAKGVARNLGEMLSARPGRNVDRNWRRVLDRSGTWTDYRAGCKRALPGQSASTEG